MPDQACSARAAGNQAQPADPDRSSDLELGLAARAALLLLSGYRLVISPLLGPACRFEPSCSRYTHLAIQKYGLLHGGALGLRRLLSCHPFHAGGFDPVP